MENSCVCTARSQKEGVLGHCGGLQFLSLGEWLSISSSPTLVCQDRAGREHNPHPHSRLWDWLSYLAGHRGSGCKKTKGVHILGANDKVANSGALFSQWVENSLSKFKNMWNRINFELDIDLRRPGVNTMQKPTKLRASYVLSALTVSIYAAGTSFNPVNSFCGISQPQRTVFPPPFPAQRTVTLNTKYRLR